MRVFVRKSVCVCACVCVCSHSAFGMQYLRIAMVLLLRRPAIAMHVSLFVLAGSLEEEANAEGVSHEQQCESVYVSLFVCQSVYACVCLLMCACMYAYMPICVCWHGVFLLVMQGLMVLTQGTGWLLFLSWCTEETMHSCLRVYIHAPHQRESFLHMIVWTFAPDKQGKMLFLFEYARWDKAYQSFKSRISICIFHEQAGIVCFITLQLSQQSRVRHPRWHIHEQLSASRITLSEPDQLEFLESGNNCLCCQRRLAWGRAEGRKGCVTRVLPACMWFSPGTKYTVFCTRATKLCVSGLKGQVYCLALSHYPVISHYPFILLLQAVNAGLLVSDEYH